MIHARIQWCLEKSNVLPAQLNGFRRHRCTMDSVLDLVSFIQNEQRKGNTAVAVFLEIKRALDTSSHVHVLHGFKEIIVDIVKRLVGYGTFLLILNYLLL